MNIQKTYDFVNGVMRIINATMNQIPK